MIEEELGQTREEVEESAEVAEDLSPKGEWEILMAVVVMMIMMMIAAK